MPRGNGKKVQKAMEIDDVQDKINTTKSISKPRQKRKTQGETTSADSKRRKANRTATTTATTTATSSSASTTSSLSSSSQALSSKSQSAAVSQDDGDETESDTEGAEGEFPLLGREEEPPKDVSTTLKNVWGEDVELVRFRKPAVDNRGERDAKSIWQPIYKVEKVSGDPEDAEIEEIGKEATKEYVEAMVKHFYETVVQQINGDGHKGSTKSSFKKISSQDDALKHAGFTGSVQGGYYPDNERYTINDMSLYLDYKGKRGLQMLSQLSEIMTYIIHRTGDEVEFGYGIKANESGGTDIDLFVSANNITDCEALRKKLKNPAQCIIEAAQFDEAGVRLTEDEENAIDKKVRSKQNKIKKNVRTEEKKKIENKVEEEVRKDKKLIKELEENAKENNLTGEDQILVTIDVEADEQLEKLEEQINRRVEEKIIEEKRKEVKSRMDTIIEYGRIAKRAALKVMNIERLKGSGESKNQIDLASNIREKFLKGSVPVVNSAVNDPRHAEQNIAYDMHSGETEYTGAEIAGTKIRCGSCSSQIGYNLKDSEGRGISGRFFSTQGNLGSLKYAGTHNRTNKNNSNRRRSRSPLPRELGSSSNSSGSSSSRDLFDGSSSSSSNSSSVTRHTARQTASASSSSVTQASSSSVTQASSSSVTQSAILLGSKPSSSLTSLSASSNLAARHLGKSVTQASSSSALSLFDSITNSSASSSSASLSGSSSSSSSATSARRSRSRSRRS